MKLHLPSFLRTYPAGMLVVAGLAMAAGVLLLLRPGTEKADLSVWTFGRDRSVFYEEQLPAWESAKGLTVEIQLVELKALERRVLSGFFAGTPVADVLEVERAIAPQAWRGPLGAVGFMDLLPLLQAEGLLDSLNQPSLAPWTDRGHLFGLPQDVHPVLLSYRADIFEEAGIQVDDLDTWEAFLEATKDLVKDLDGDGHPDQYVFELPETDGATAVAFILQAGSDLILENGEPNLTDSIIRDVLCMLADWAAPPERITADLELNTGAGNKLRDQGFVLSWLTPDWRSRLVEQYIPSLEGRLKLMPLPAWIPGGRRTTVWGGSMLGLAASGSSVDEAWSLVRHLVFNEEVARKTWSRMRILSPVKAYWNDPVFDQPVAYFSGQATGRLYADVAGDIPARSSSVFYAAAVQEVGNTLAQLIREARRLEPAQAEELYPLAEQLLAASQANLLRQMQRTQEFSR